jgi:glyoxylase-like metal-dependent hydrolase (beta-lactamase superfamily II)
MKIHHLNCGSLCPLSHPLLNRAMPQLDRFNLVCHCLLIESPSGLILVDTGMGLEDVKNHERYISNFRFKQLARPKLDLEETAFMQITRMGFNPKDVKHIIATHFDSDHIGGLADFPWAKVHLLKDEWEAAQNPKGLREKARYNKIRWEQNRDIETYETQGDAWEGFKRVQNLKGIDPSIYLVSLPGHTKGHAGVLIEKEANIFMAGDAFIQEVQLGEDKVPLPISLYGRMTNEDSHEAETTLKKLKVLKQTKPELSIFCSHDFNQFQKMVNRK